MRAAWREIGFVCVLAMCLAPIGDWAHVTTGTTAYLWDAGPHVLRSPLWFIVCIGGVAVAASVLALRLERAAPSPPQAPGSVWAAPAVGSIAAVMLIYSASALLRDAPLGISTIALLSAAALAWALTSGTRNGLLVAGFVALVGTTGEIVITLIDAGRYGSDIDTLAGVTPWLPAVHFAFGNAVAAIHRAWASRPATAP